MVYATCTLHPKENEEQIRWFLSEREDWEIEPPPPNFGIPATAQGWVKVWPHRLKMDGFFMVKLRHRRESNAAAIATAAQKKKNM